VRQRWTSSERLVFAAFAAALLIAVWSKVSGALDFWAYESLAIPALQISAILPIAALAIPILSKDESDRD